MHATTHKTSRVGAAILVCAALATLFALFFLAQHVAREMRQLQAAQTNGIQWGLAQSEVDYLRLLNAFSPHPAHGAVDLGGFRRQYDIFFSRIDTVQKAPLYVELRKDPVVVQSLARVARFLDSTVDIIDGPDMQLRSALPTMHDALSTLHSDMRVLSVAGLSDIARLAELRRETVGQALAQMAILVAVLIGLMAALLARLYRVNALNVRRGREIALARDRMSTIIATSLDAVVVTDPAGRITETNAAATTLFRQPLEGLRDRTLSSLLRPPLNTNLARFSPDQWLNDLVGAGRKTMLAMPGTGLPFAVEVAVQAALTDEGKILIAFLRDISGRLEAEADLVTARDQALASEQVKSDFLAVMSHEIRTPLNGLLGNLSLLRETALTKAQAAFARKMDISGRLLMRHVSDVLDITKYDAGKLELTPVAFNLVELVTDILASQRDYATQQNSTLSWAWDGTAQNWITADPDAVQSILINLVSNAVKFTKDGAIRVTLHYADETLGIAVNDTGVGMQEDLSRRVFEDFATGDSSYNRLVGGTGLGLSIAKRFALAMKGEIGVQSEPGLGSRFWVRLPVAAAKPPALSAKPAQQPRTARAHRILVVEDNRINREMVCDMLTQMGHQVSTADDGCLGVKMAKAAPYDLILMDIAMPVLDGRQATRAIRGCEGPNRDTPILAVTANVLHVEQQSFLRDGMQGVIVKPLTRDSLHRALGTALPTLAQALPETVVDLSPLKARFAQEVESLIAWLETATESDLPMAQERLHRVAGSAAVFAANELRDALITIESSITIDELSDCCVALRDIWGETRLAMAQAVPVPSQGDRL